MMGWKLKFDCIRDTDPAADCEPEWFFKANWVHKRWGFYRTQSHDFFLLGFCYFIR